MNKYLLLLIVPILIVVSFLGYKAFYHPTPSQVVTNAFKALMEKDRELWDESVNTDALISQTTFLYKDQFEIDGSEDIASRLGKIYNQILSVTDDDSRLSVEINDYFAGTRDELYRDHENELFGLIESFDKIDITSEKINDRKAIVNFTLHHKVYDYPFEFKVMLERYKKDWKIVNLLNVNQFLSMLEEKEKERKNKAIDEKTKEMMRALLIKEYRVMTKDYWFKKIWPLSTVPVARTEHDIRVQNVSDQPITSFGIKLSFRRSGFAVVEKSVVFNKVLDLNKEILIKETSFNPFIYDQVSVNNVPEITLLFIEFESGDRIENSENLETRFME